MPAPDQLGARRPSAWGLLVTASAAVIVGVGLLLVVWWGATRQERIATYAVRGTLNGVTLDLAGADATIVGAGRSAAVDVRRVDRFAFGRRADSGRAISAGVLRLTSRCPDAILGSCSSSYRLRIPDNVPVTVRTSSGDVRFTGFRGTARIETGTGDVSVGGFCGFGLQAQAETGDVSANAACAPERLELRSRTGSVSATVPPGRYRVDADSDSGSTRVSGLVPVDDAPFVIQALSSAGDVNVEARP